MEKLTYKIHLLFYPIYEKLWIERYRKLSKGDIYIDLGSYVGEFLPYASKVVGDKGKVIAVEPDPENLKFLRITVNTHNLGNIHVKDSIIGLKDGIEKIHSNKQYSSSHLKVKGEVYSVTSVTLNTLFDQYNIKKVNVLKLNIEGAELDAVEGGIDRLKDIEHIVISGHVIENRNTVYALETMLQKNGFKTIIKKRLFGTKDHLDLYAFNTST